MEGCRVVELEVKDDAEAVSERAGEVNGGGHFYGDDVGEGGFSEAGRPVEEDVVDRLIALLGGFEEDGEVLLELGLTDEFGEAPGTERELRNAVIDVALRVEVVV